MQYITRVTWYKKSERKPPEPLKMPMHQKLMIFFPELNVMLNDSYGYQGPEDYWWALIENPVEQTNKGGDNA